MQKLVITIIVVCSIIAILVIRSFHQPKNLFHCEGVTMGTTYHVTYLDERRKSYQASLDSILTELNNSLSTYIETSLISRFNRADSSIMIDKFFKEVAIKAKDVFVRTDGAFDPTVMPLVNAWGFGHEDTMNVDSSVVDSLMNAVGFDMVSYDCPRRGECFAIKSEPNVQLDFSAIAKGYGVDVLGELLEARGVTNYNVEIGGEVRVSGTNERGNPWRIGINKPEENASRYELTAIVALKNKALATSGNYRNFYEKDGKKYVHTINPKTGYPVLSNLLSASVIANDCATADAYATAFMVMGLEKALETATREPTLEAYFIYMDEGGEMKTAMTTAMRKLVVDLL